MALNPQVTTSFTSHFVEDLKKDVLPKYRSSLILAGLGKAGVHAANNGEVTRWFDVPDLGETPATYALTEAVTPSGENFSSTNLEATLVQYGNFITISDRLKNIPVTDMQREVSDIITRQAAAVTDNIVRAELNATANDVFANGVASIALVESGTVEISSADIKGIGTDMKVSNVPTFDDGLYRLVLHPYMVESLLNETGNADLIVAASRQGTAANMLSAAELTNAFGFKILQTNQIQADAVSTNTYENIALGRDAFGTVSHQNLNLQILVKGFGEGGSADPLNQVMTVGWKMMYVAKRLKEAGIRSLHAFGA